MAPRSPSCWIFTADDRVDRRILAHLAPLRALGLDPVIFAADWQGEGVEGETIFRPADSVRSTWIGRIPRPLLPRRSRHKLFSHTLDPEGDWGDFLAHVYDFRRILRRSEQAWQRREVAAPALIMAIDLPLLPVALSWSERFAVPLSIDCHECWAEQAAIFYPSQPQLSRSAALWEERLYPLCHLRITVGERLAEMMRQRFHCDFSVLYSACNPPTLPPRAENFLRSRFPQIPLQARIALFQGRLTPYRNLQTLIRDATRLEAGQHILLLGDGPLLESLQELTRELRLESTVHFPGHVAQTELLNWTAEAELGILPHLSVNSYFSCSAPNKLFEYIAAGLPMLYDPGMTEIDRIVGVHGFGTAVCCHDSQLLGDAIRRLLTDEKERQRYRANLRERGKKFLARAQEEKLQEMMRGVLRA